MSEIWREPLFEYQEPGTTVTKPFLVEYHWPVFEPTLKGWECPKCGRCYAPWVEECKHCGPFYTITVTTSGPGDLIS